MEAVADQESKCFRDVGGSVRAANSRALAEQRSVE